MCAAKKRIVIARATVANSSVAPRDAAARRSAKTKETVDRPHGIRTALNPMFARMTGVALPFTYAFQAG